jgi:hypothetical protein
MPDRTRCLTALKRAGFWGRLLALCLVFLPFRSRGDALSLPDTGRDLRLSQPKPPSDSSEDSESGEENSGMDETPSPSPATPEVARSPVPPGLVPDHTPGPSSTHSLPASVVPSKPWVTTIPNPARGDKLDFRVITAGPAKVHIVVYDNLMDRVAVFESQGDRLFDVIWKLKKVPEGIYYFQAVVDERNPPAEKTLPMQSFVVLKREHPARK